MTTRPAGRALPAGRTLEEFLPLKPAEQQLLNACRSGEPATISTKRPESASDDNTVRAALLRFLALGGDEHTPVHEHGVQLVGAWIAGELDMASTAIPSDLTLLGCHCDTAPVFRGAKIAGSLNLDGCRIPGMKGDRLACDGDLFLGQDFVSKKEVRLLGAQIGGNLDCSGANLDGEKGPSLSADRAVIKGSVLLGEGFSATGNVRLHNAQIGSNLDCSGAKFDGKDGDALSADGVVIKGSAFLRNGFSATGAVRLPSAQIGHDVVCINAKLDSTEGAALFADKIVIRGSIFLNAGFSAAGEVRILGAQIEGNLACNGANLDGKGSAALTADGAVINGSIFLNAGFSAVGDVRLLGARIGGDLACLGGKFDGKGGYAISADGAVIKGNVFLNAGFSATGTVRLLNVQIGGNLACISAKFNGKGVDALLANRMNVKGAFFFRELPAPVNDISLADACVGQLADDAGSWGNNLYLDGFVYDSLAGNAPTDAATRLAWLDKQLPAHTGLNDTGFRPQPWKQLARVLREMGHADDSRQVSIAFERRWGEAKLVRYPLIHFLFGVFTGYGYRPMRLLGWMLSVWLACAMLYWCAALNEVFAPSDPLVFQNPEYAVCRPDYVAPASSVKDVQGAGNWYLCDKLRGEYAGFSPLAYSLDVILPLVDLQQENSWSPLIPTPKAAWYQELTAFDRYHLTRLLLWFEILFGWVSSLLLVAVVSGLTKRREE